MLPKSKNWVPPEEINGKGVWYLRNQAFWLKRCEWRRAHNLPRRIVTFTAEGHERRPAGAHASPKALGPLDCALLEVRGQGWDLFASSRLQPGVSTQRLGRRVRSLVKLNLGLGCFGVPARPAQPKPGWQSQCCWLPPPQELDELGFLLVPIARPESFFFFFW